MSRDVTRFIGYQFEPFRFVIERGKIREFALAVGDDNPLYVDQKAADAAGLTDITIPPTFPTAMDMWGGPTFFDLVETFQLDMLKVLHGEQEYEYLADVYPGDEITATIRVTDAITKQGSSGGMHLITLATEYANQRGELVLIGRSTIIERY